MLAARQRGLTRKVQLTQVTSPGHSLRKEGRGKRGDEMGAKSRGML